VCLLGAAEEPPPGFHAEPLIVAAEPVLFAGESGGMKTTCALHLACATAIGAPLFGRYPTREGPVLIVSEEDPLSVIQNRVHAMIRRHGWPRERVLANLHLLAVVDADIALGRWREYLLGVVARLGVRLVIMDPLADIASGDANDNTARPEVVATWRALAAAGATPVLVHHLGKPGPERALKDRIRGATAIPSASRCTLIFEATDAGVVVHNPKQSRGAKVPAFVVAHDIVSDPANPALWHSARFTTTTVRKAEMTDAEAKLLALILETPGRSGSELQELAGVSRRALLDGLESLQRAGRARFEAGPRGAKLWHPVAVDDLSDPSDLSRTGPDTCAGDLSDLSPKGEQDRSDRSAAPGGLLEFAPPDDTQAWLATETDEDAAYLADERAALGDRAA
jgi:hypothetical protein